MAALSTTAIVFVYCNRGDDFIGQLRVHSYFGMIIKCIENMKYKKSDCKLQDIMPLLFLVAVLHISVFESCFLSETEGSWVKEVSLWCVKNINKVCCSQLTLRPKHLALTSPAHIPGVTAHLTGCDLDAVLASLFSSFFSSSVLRKLLLKLKLSKLHTSKTSKLPNKLLSWQTAFLVNNFTI